MRQYLTLHGLVDWLNLFNQTELSPKRYRDPRSWGGRGGKTGWLVMFNAELSPKRYCWRGQRFQELEERGRLYIYIPKATLAGWLNMFNAELGSEEVLSAGQRSQELGRKRETVYT